MLPISATLVLSIEIACVAGGFVSFGAHEQAAKPQGKLGGGGGGLGRKKKHPIPLTASTLSHALLNCQNRQIRRLVS